MSEIIQIARPPLDAAAEKQFFQICHFQQDSAKMLRMREKAFAVRQSFLDQIAIRALIERFEPDILTPEGLHINGHCFPCHGLSHLDFSTVAAVYAFVLTAGDVYGGQGKMSDTLYSDVWGTAYTCLAGLRLQEILRSLHESEDSPVYVSEAIAPGYYDMDIGKLAELFQIIDGGLINVTLQGTMMVPLKSCAGFYFVVRDPQQLRFLGERCMFCAHKGSNCGFCRFGQEKRLRQTT